MPDSADTARPNWHRGRAMLIGLDDVAHRLTLVPHQAKGWMLSWRRYAIIVAVLPEGEHIDGSPEAT